MKTKKQMMFELLLTEEEFSNLKEILRLVSLFNVDNHESIGEYKNTASNLYWEIKNTMEGK